MRDETPRRKFHPVYLSLALPFIAHVLVPTYNRIDPQLFGIPFFYWWQMAWIPFAALAILPVYLFEQARGK
jgi:hypothetical protein